MSLASCILGARERKNIPHNIWYPLRTLLVQISLGLFTNTKKPPQGRFFCIGDTNAMNFELLLSPEYYLATMSLYEEIKRNNIKPLNLLQTFDNDISLNEAIY